MQFKLKKPLQVMNKEAGEYETADEVVVSYVGKKGLKALKGLQDVIFKTFQDTAGKGGEKKTAKSKDITVDDMLSMLDMTGNSEKVFDSVMTSLKEFATIGKVKLADALQNEMDIDDLDDLYQEVLKSFLLPKIIRKMNSMSK